MTDSRTVTAPPDPSPPLAPPQVITAFSRLLLLKLLASLDQKIVATALPTVVGDLGSLQDVSLVVTGYLVASIAATPIFGKLGDLFGRTRLLMATTVLFLAGSVLCGLAPSIPLLVAFRAVQGAGAGGMIALAMACVGDLVPPRERGRYQGYIQATFALASVAGPLAGGLLVDSVGWRWIFYVNVPIGLVALVVLRGMTAITTGRRQARVDYPGAALFAGAVVSLLLVATWGGQSYAWTSPQILGLVVAAVALAGVFLWWETRAAEPILPPRLLRNPVVAIAGVTMFMTALGFFAAIVYVPVFVQIVLGASATTAGLLLLPLTLGILAATIVSGRIITRTGRYKVFPVLGLAKMTLATYLLSTMSTGTPAAVVALYMVLLGLGFGGVTQVLVLAVQNAVERRELGTATASTNFFRGLGGALGVAVFGAVLNSRLGGVAASALTSPDAIRGLPAAARDSAVAAVAQGLHSVFLTAVPFVAVALVAVCFLPERPLQTGAPRKA